MDRPDAEIRKYLNNLLDDVFQEGSVDCVIVDRMSTFARREYDSSKKPQDVFYYDLLADISVNVNKNAFPSVDRNGWIVGNFTIKDVKFVVEFRPSISYGKKLKYSVKYIMIGGDYYAQFNEVIYKSDGRIRRMNIDPSTIADAIKIDQHEYFCEDLCLDGAPSSSDSS